MDHAQTQSSQQPKITREKADSPLVKRDSHGGLWGHLGERMDLSGDCDIGGGHWSELAQV